MPGPLVVAQLEKRQKVTVSSAVYLQGARGDKPVHVDQLLVEREVVDGSVCALGGLQEVRDVDEDEKDAKPDEALLGPLVQVQLVDEEQHLQAVEAEGREPGLVAEPRLLEGEGEGRHDAKEAQGEGGQLPGGCCELSSAIIAGPRSCSCQRAIPG